MDTKRKRRNLDATFKTKVVLEALKEEMTLAELASKYEVHTAQISVWRKEFLQNATAAFEGNKDDRKELERLRKEKQVLHRKIGEQSMDIEFLKKLAKTEPAVRSEMVSSGEKISIVKQCRLLDIKRGSYYYKPVTMNIYDLLIAERIDSLYTEDPTRGQRRMKHALWKRFGQKVGRAKIRTLMEKMGIEAIYPKKRLSVPNHQHAKYPYLLRGLKIERVNQVWSTDITYIRLKHGFAYLVAVIDWYSRHVLSWRLSTSLDASFCVEALQEAIRRFGTPEIFNTDQGCQFTSSEFTGILLSHGIGISMDGKGRALDNVFVERLWRTVKYENVYIREYASVKQCRKGLTDYFNFYNNRREHSSLAGNYPAEVYFGKVTLNKAA